MTLGLYKHTANRPILKEDIENLKKQTQIGSYIKFKKTKNDILLETTRTIEKIEGIVEEIYPNIFKVNGKYYSWVDYAIGYVY